GVDEPAPIAFCQHLSFAASFFAAALFLAWAHRCAAVPAAEATAPLRATRATSETISLRIFVSPLVTDRHRQDEDRQQAHPYCCVGLPSPRREECIRRRPGVKREKRASGPDVGRQQTCDVRRRLENDVVVLHRA